jgi:membrane protein insertase Oxa1/YidC/SpoIIIJ
MTDKNGIHLPFGWDILLAVIGVVVGAIWYYAKFENKVVTLESKMEEANLKINELVEKHIEDEESRYLEMEEQIKWYQKEFNLNPLSWKKKKK